MRLAIKTAKAWAFRLEKTLKFWLNPALLASSRELEPSNNNLISKFCSLDRQMQEMSSQKKIGLLLFLLFWFQSLKVEFGHRWQVLILDIGTLKTRVRIPPELLSPFLVGSGSKLDQTVDSALASRCCSNSATVRCDLSVDLDDCEKRKEPGSVPCKLDSGPTNRG